MKDILLVFLNDLENIDEFNDIIDGFVERNYTIYALDNIKEDEYFSIDSLPELVEFYKSQHKDINKVVVLSNSRDLIFSWYRCYNSLVDDFVYFVDKDEKNYFDINDRHFSFYYNLYEFNGIDEETIEGKIYLNINFSNYNNIIDFLIKDGRLNYFNNIDKYNFNEPKTSKKDIFKNYLFNRYEYKFELKNCNNSEEIKMHNHKLKELVIDDKFIISILDNIYIIPYITILFYKAKEESLSELLLKIYRNLKEVDKKYQIYVYKKLYIYINNKNVDFKEKIYISSLLVMINNGDERLAEFIMKTLLEDDEYIEYHYSVLYNMLFYKTNENLLISNYVHVAMRKEFIKLGKFIKEKEQINIGIEENKENQTKVAIHYDQLLSLQHSPTNLALRMAENLVKYFEHYEVKIFVEENYITNSNEVILTNVYTSSPSIEQKDIHARFLNDDNIEIYYSDLSLGKTEKTKEIVEEINKFNPNIIYSTSSISLAMEILYPYYPVVYQTHGGINFSTLCDAYVVYGKLQKEKLLKINKEIGLLNTNKIYLNKPPGSMKKQYKMDYKKIDFGLKEDDFVMVTVGNRLQAELTKNFIDLIAFFMKMNKNVVWILVGGQDIDYLNNKYKNLIKDNKIIRLEYENDLIALYKICDVYLNPVRDGGAGSVSIAINAGVPTIVEKTSQDSVFVIGKENCVANAKEAYLEELEKIYIDKGYKQYKGKLMKQIGADRKDWQSYVKEYLKIFDLAIESHNKRTNKQ